RPGYLGGAVPAGVHVAGLAAEAGVLERRSLIRQQTGAGTGSRGVATQWTGGTLEPRGHGSAMSGGGERGWSGNLSSRRSIMTLFSAPNDPWSHRTRIVLAEKGISIDIVSVEPGKLPEDLLDLNPYHSVPTLVDRDLVLYDSRVIIEYLDERFPHPPLMPVDPVTRAQFRLALYRIERDWYALVQQIEQDPDKKNTVRLKKILRDTVLQSTELFKVKPYFLSDEFSLVDATIAPVLWRLPYYEIDLPPQAQPIIKYASLIFSLAAFRESLSDAEQEMRLI